MNYGETKCSPICIPHNEAWPDVIERSLSLTPTMGDGISRGRIPVNQSRGLGGVTGAAISFAPCEGVFLVFVGAENLL
jgi:hypothetical protein